jgi:hypothetical protein
MQVIVPSRKKASIVSQSESSNFVLHVIRTENPAMKKNIEKTFGTEVVFLRMTSHLKVFIFSKHF